jgi:hypothetical protein
VEEEELYRNSSNLYNIVSILPRSISFYMDFEGVSNIKVMKKYIEQEQEHRHGEQFKYMEMNESLICN